MPEQILTVRVISDTTQATRDLRSLDRSTQTFAGSMKQFAKTAGIGFGLAQGARFIGDTINAASNLEESINAVQVVFGDAADQILDFTSDTNDAVFETAGSLNQMATQTGALLQNMGFSAEEAADATVMLTRRAADMASVHNKDVAEALNAINSSLRGQSEPITDFAADTLVATVQAQALADGLIEEGEAMDRTTKAAATINAIMAQTANTQGDAANTAGSFANQQRALAEQFGVVQVALGERLLPLWQDFQTALIDLAPLAIAVVDTIDPIVTSIGAMAEQVSILTGFLPDWVDGTDDAAESNEDLNFAMKAVGIALGLYNPAADEAKQRADDLEGAAAALGTAAARAGNEGLSIITGAINDMRVETENATEAQVLLADELRAAADPTFNLVKANRDFQEVLNDVYADGVVAGDEIFRLADATFTLQSAQERYAAEGSTEGLEALAAAGRISTEQLATTVSWLQEIDGYTANATVNIDLTGVDPGALAPVDLPVGNPLEPVFLHAGGIVRSPTLAVLGEAGPEAVVPLDGPGTTAMGGNTYHIHVEAGLSDPSAVADAVAEALQRYELRNGTR